MGFSELATAGSVGVGEAGLDYRRNRYYDPHAGQFSQPDPIGLAGGMNLYGFAGGDPVNFSDPFGLCPPELTGRPCLNPLAAIGRRLRLRPDGKGAFGAGRWSAEGGIRNHQGADFSAPLGTPVGAADQGEVVGISREGSGPGGKYVILGHSNAEGKTVSYTAYLHLGEIAPGLGEGEEVDAGARIGNTGDTGNAEGEPPHLHFEIRTERLGGQLDPLDYFDVRRP